MHKNLEVTITDHKKAGERRFIAVIMTLKGGLLGSAKGATKAECVRNMNNKISKFTAAQQKMIIRHAK